MNYRYVDDNHTIQVYSNGLKIKINYDSYTGINFNLNVRNSPIF